MHLNDDYKIEYQLLLVESLQLLFVLEELQHPNLVLSFPRIVGLLVKDSELPFLLPSRS